MGLFQANDINAGVEEYQKTLQAKLIDVREEDEYVAGHNPGQHQHPLEQY